MSEHKDVGRTDEFGYVWRRVQREHTVEIVGYDGDVEIGTALITRSDNSPEALKRMEEISWVEDRVNVMYPDGVTANRLMEVVRRQYDIYGTLP